MEKVAERLQINPSRQAAGEGWPNAHRRIRIALMPPPESQWLLREASRSPEKPLGNEGKAGGGAAWRGALHAFSIFWMIADVSATIQNLSD